MDFCKYSNLFNVTLNKIFSITYNKKENFVLFTDAGIRKIAHTVAIITIIIVITIPNILNIIFLFGSIF